MSDIDFDELDRAVNGAINGTPVPSSPSVNEEVLETPVVEPVQRTSLASSRGAALAAPIETTPISSTPVLDIPPVALIAPTTPPVARPSSGRFMDIVHPSSDMRTTGSAPVVSAPIVSKPVEAPVAEAISYEAPAWNEPLESPFLPDTKVEKRPLGGTGLLEAPEPQELLESLTMPDPIDFAESQITEEVVDVEPVMAEVPVIEVQPPTDVQIEPEVITEHPKVEELPAIVFPEEEPVGPASITQQYKEQPSSNQESGAIYDTESYHQPVVKPPKSKSGALAIVWISLLVVFGAAAGWAVYTFLLPLL